MHIEKTSHNKRTTVTLNKYIFKRYFDDGLRQFNYNYRERDGLVILTATERLQDFENTYHHLTYQFLVKNNIHKK